MGRRHPLSPDAAPVSVIRRRVADENVMASHHGRGSVHLHGRHLSGAALGRIGARITELRLTPARIRQAIERAVTSESRP